jgi:hypothetical protein
MPCSCQSEVGVGIARAAFVDEENACAWKLNSIALVIGNAHTLFAFYDGIN